VAVDCSAKTLWPSLSDQARSHSILVRLYDFWAFDFAGGAGILSSVIIKRPFYGAILPKTGPVAQKYRK
jgi:hypothetical protein